MLHAQVSSQDLMLDGYRFRVVGRPPVAFFHCVVDRAVIVMRTKDEKEAVEMASRDTAFRGSRGPVGSRRER